jgi:transposase
MAHHISGQSRTQTSLFPEVLDHFVTEGNSVRVVDVFVDGLDHETLGFERVIAKSKGRPGYHPAIPLKLYIWLPQPHLIFSSLRKRKPPKH